MDMIGQDADLEERSGPHRGTAAQIGARVIVRLYRQNWHRVRTAIAIEIRRETDRSPWAPTRRAETGATVQWCSKGTARGEWVEGLRVVLNTFTGGFIGKGTIAGTHARIG